MPVYPKRTLFLELSDQDQKEAKERLLNESKKLKAKMINKMCNIADAVRENANLYSSMAPEILKTAKEADEALLSIDKVIADCEAWLAPKEELEDMSDKVINFKDTNAYKDKRVKELANSMATEMRQVITKYKRAFDKIDYNLLVKYDITLDSKNKKGK